MKCFVKHAYLPTCKYDLSVDDIHMTRKARGVHANTMLSRSFVVLKGHDGVVLEKYLQMK